MTMFDAIFLDLDGTLIDTRSDFLAALGETLKDFGVSPSCVDLDLVTRLIGRGSDYFLMRVFERVMGQACQPQALAEQLKVARPVFARHYRRHNGEHARVFDGVELGLKKLSQLGVPMACVTNKVTPLAQQLLERFDLARYFDAIVGGDTVERTKPAPDLLIKAAERLGGVNLAKCLMIGDSSNDAQAAQAAGCACQLVTYGYNHGRPIQSERAMGYLTTLLGVVA